MSPSLMRDTSLALLLLAAAASPAAAAADAPADPAAPAAKPAVAKEPTVARVRVAVGSEERVGWRLGVEEAGATALLQDDGVVAWAMVEPAEAWLESEERPLSALSPAHLAGALGHEMAPIRERCEELLIAQGSLAAAAVGEAVRAPSAEARRHALQVLAERPAKQWRARIRERLMDDVEPAVRRAALAAYAALECDDLVPVCLALLKFDDDARVRHDAIGRLGRSRDLTVIDPLLVHLDGCEERSLRLVTFDALRRLTGRKFGRDEAAWRAWWTNHRAELLPEEAH